MKQKNKRYISESVSHFECFSVNIWGWIFFRYPSRVGVNVS